MAVSTDAKDIALYYLNKSAKPVTKRNIVTNICIVKQLLEQNYSKEELIMAIDLNIDKMYSLGYLQYVIKEVSIACRQQAKEDEIKDAQERIRNTTTTYKGVDVSATDNRNKSKLEARADFSRKRKDDTIDLFKR